MEILEQLFGDNGSHKSECVVVVQQTLCKGKEHVLELLKEVESQGGEGLMLRQANSLVSLFTFESW